MEITSDNAKQYQARSVIKRNRNTAMRKQLEQDILGKFLSEDALKTIDELNVSPTFLQDIKKYFVMKGIDNEFKKDLIDHDKATAAKKPVDELQLRYQMDDLLSPSILKQVSSHELLELYRRGKTQNELISSEENKLLKAWRVYHDKPEPRL